MCQVRLPTTAVALELLLRYEESGIISLDHCKRLAIDCNIDPETELPHVLWLLHHSTGSIRYYPGDSILCGNPTPEVVRYSQHSANSHFRFQVRRRARPRSQKQTMDQRCVHYGNSEETLERGSSPHTGTNH